MISLLANYEQRRQEAEVQAQLEVEDEEGGSAEQGACDALAVVSVAQT